MDWLKTLPTTNLRIFVGIVLALIFVVGSMIAGAFGKLPPVEYVRTLAVFIAAQMGIDALQFTAKRMTVKPEMFQQALSQESVDPPPAPPGVGDTPTPPAHN